MQKNKGCRYQARATQRYTEGFHAIKTHKHFSSSIKIQRDFGYRISIVFESAKGKRTDKKKDTARAHSKRVCCSIPRIPIQMVFKCIHIILNWNCNSKRTKTSSSNIVSSAPYRPLPLLSSLLPPTTTTLITLRRQHRQRRRLRLALGRLSTLRFLLSFKPLKFIELPLLRRKLLLRRRRRR